ncbi:MAG: hypothetical protein V2I33_20855 [Kangiellaceae bacterium]|nr:hypothetical protein [Kangiellaceae bacterium]
MKTSQITELSAKYTEAAEAVRKLEDTNKELKLTLHAGSDMGQTDMDEIERLKARIVELEAAGAGSIPQEELDRMNSQLERKRKAKKDLQNKCTTAEGERDELARQLSNKDGEIERLAALVSASQQDAPELRKTIG